MRKTQRLRLAALLAQGANINATEALELAWLNALATAYPNPAADEDDAPSTFRAALMDAVSGRKALGAELATAQTAIAALESQLAAAKSAVPALPEGALAAADAAALRTQLAAANDSAAALTTQLHTFGTALGLKPAELAGKSEQDIRAAVDSRLGALAGEKIAELGFPEQKLPASTQSGTAAASSIEDLQAQMKGETDPAKVGALAAKANALRNKQWGVN